MEKIEILGIPIMSITLDELLLSLKKGVLVTPNVDHLVKLQKDDDFKKCYQQADWIICDSNVVNMAAKFLSKPFKEVIPGSSFFPAFYNYHRESEHIKIFLLGAAEGVATRAMSIINNKVGREIIVDAYSPSYGFEANDDECNKIVDLIVSSTANVLVVGVGAPKQEKWIMKYKSSMPNIDVFMALGATIDFEAGNIRRAPLMFQKLNLEWLYRLYKEPKRLWRRYLIEDMAFFYFIIKQKFKTNS